MIRISHDVVEMVPITYLSRLGINSSHIHLLEYIPRDSEVLTQITLAPEDWVEWSSKWNMSSHIEMKHDVKDGYHQIILRTTMWRTISIESK